MLAWVRTAVSLIAFGFALYKAFFYLREHEPQRHVEQQLLQPRTYGMLMMAAGVFSLALATWQHRRQMRRLRARYPEVPGSLSAVLAGLIALIGVIGFTAALLRQ